MSKLWRPAVFSGAAALVFALVLAVGAAQSSASTDPSTTTPQPTPDCAPGQTCPCPDPGPDGTYYCDQDSDGDGYFDSDETSAGSDPKNAASTPEVWWHGTCEDGVDNDIDGATDRDDPGCQDDPCAAPPPPEPSDPPQPMPPYYCDQDSDGDGYWDSEETSAGSDPDNPASTPEVWWYGTCEDGVDNDLDGATDGDEPDCQDPCDAPPPMDPAQPYPYPYCEKDSDGDGYWDSEETSAGSDPNNPASTPEAWWYYGTCEDGADNDLDGATDDAELDCQDPCTEPQPGDPPPPYYPFYCDEDTDGDSYFDSEEISAGSDPKDAASTPEVSWYYGTCDDGADNDADGAADSDDSGCSDNCYPPPPPLPPDQTEPPNADGGQSSPGYYCDQDSDGDGYYDSEESGAGSDPNNPASTPEVWWYGTCEDGADNDLDGATDADDDMCQEPDCIYPMPMPADDGGSVPPGYPCVYDADGDGTDDFTEEMLGSDPNDAGSTPEHLKFPESCSDGADNDGDGALDGADTGCQPDADGDGVPDATDNCPTMWNPDQADGDNDGAGDACEDSDGDGFFDLDETSYGSDPNDAGSTPEIFWVGNSCEDGADNDGDGATDLDDAGCDFPKPLPGEDTPMKGDTDCSGGIDSVDALYVLLAVAQLPSPGGCSAPLDVNCTGAPDAVDALFILLQVANLGVPVLPGCAPLGV